MFSAVDLNNWSSQLTSLQEGVVRDCTAFIPELVVCATIVILLLLRLVNSFNRLHLGWISLILTGFGLVTACGQWSGACAALDPRVGPHASSLELFTGLLAFDNFTIFLRVLLLGF